MLKARVILYLLLLIPCFNFYSQISVDGTLTAEEMVVDVLVNNDCIAISNVSASTGTDFGDVNGIGVFNAEDTDFPFESGIILTSGSIQNAPGPNFTLSSGGNSGWTGDSDLEANTNAFSTNNASSISFDFVPQIPVISFNFIMASEEYNQEFECFFSDAFAFILTDQVTGEVQNLAVLPGTNIPIEVTNIREEVPGECFAVNPQFFDTYNFEPFNSSEDSPTNYNGQTVILTATGDVVVGNNYTLKLVVADAGIPDAPQDGQLDTAVFLEAGSFDFGINLGEDISIENGNPFCENTTGFEIGVAEDTSGSLQYQWNVFNDNTNTFQPIAGETANTYFVTSSGIYRIDVLFSSGCVFSDEIVIDFVSPPVANPPGTLFACDDISNDGIATFNLEDPDFIAAILGTQDPNVYQVSFYRSEETAIAGTNSLFIEHQNTTNPETLFARVQVLDTECFAVTDFQIVVQTTPNIELLDEYRICVDQNSQVVAEDEGLPSPPTIETNLDPFQYRFAWYLNGTLLPDQINPFIQPTEAGVYSVEIEDVTNGCSASFETSVIISSAPFSISAAVTTQAFSSNHIIEVIVDGLGDYSYQLDFGTPTTNSIFSNVSGGPHTVTVSDKNGCGSLTSKVFVIDYPRVLTPNQDGYNDLWNIYNLVYLDPLATVYVFDRNGKLLKEMSVTNSGWDGTYDGVGLPSNDYWFLVNYKEDEIAKEFRGHFTLKR